MFIKWDTNADGHISLEELKQNMAEITNIFELDEPDIMQIMEQADTNRDGQIDYTEFLTAAFQKQTLLQEDNLRRAFNIFDIDGDGQISMDELKGGFGACSGLEDSNQDQLWTEIMSQADSNGDGFICYQEFVTNMQQVIGKRATFMKPLDQK